jgi:hypothetical protein
MSKIVAKVTASIEIDPEIIIKKLMKKYDMPASKVTMYAIYEYVENFTSGLKGEGPGVYDASDEPSIDGFDDDTFDRISEVLVQMQEGE